MKLLMILALGTVAVAAPARAEPVQAPAPLARLAMAARCDDKASPWRAWCTATKFAEGTVAALPGKNLVGITVALESGKDVSTALQHDVTLVTLAVTQTGSSTTLKLTDIRPETDDERRQVAEAVAAVTLVLKGKTKTATLPKDLAAFAGSRTGSYVAAKGKRAWTWNGANPSELRKLGAHWVLIETAPNNTGIWASVLTEHWK